MIDVAPANRSLADRRAFGVINLDKPAGPTSHQVVSWVKELLDIQRAGHAGTLDPKVTGCLPVLLDRGTRLAQALLTGPKEYVAILELHDVVPERFPAVLEEFAGEIYQKPPRKSAVARRLRTREIFDLRLLEVVDRRALVRIECESGTYVRKLCHDLGLAAGVGGHMGDLRRIGTQPFDDRDLVTLHDLADAVAVAEAGETAMLEEILQPAERALDHLPVVTIAESAAASVEHGAPVFAPGVVDADEVDPTERPLVACFTPEGSAVCLGRLVGDPAATRGEVVALERVLV